MVDDENVRKLKNSVVSRRFVNCYSREIFQGNLKELEIFLKKLKEIHRNIVYVDIDIKEFETCKEEEQEVKKLLEMINKSLEEKEFNQVELDAISISDALIKCSHKFDQRALLVFHYFQDPSDEKEKDILRSLRKALRNIEEIKSYLNILIVSNKKTYSWELFPESNLDERQVYYFKI